MWIIFGFAMASWFWTRICYPKRNYVRVFTLVGISYLLLSVGVVKFYPQSNYLLGFLWAEGLGLENLMVLRVPDPPRYGDVL